MRPLDDPSTSTSSANNSNSTGTTDNDENDNQKKNIPPLQHYKNIFQRLIISPLASILHSLLSSRIARLVFFFIIGSAVAVGSAVGQRRMITSRGGAGTLPQEVVYSEFLRLVETGNVHSVRFEDGTRRILFDLKPHSHSTLEMNGSGSGSGTALSSATNSVKNKKTTIAPPPPPPTATVTMRGRSRTPRQFYTRHIPDPTLITTLMANEVEFGSVRASMTGALVRVVGTALALWVPLIPMFIIMRRFLEGKNGGGTNRKKGKERSVPPTMFSDVAGVGPAKDELREVVACLRDSRRFSKLGAKLPSGVLLCGPPGTGKTLLARAVAGEAGVPFISVSASEFVELFVGRGAARVRELFAEARKRAPCVVFIDELDAVGGKRGAGLNEERDQTLNQLLTELDGFDGRPGVLLLAATNRPDVLDPALLRPGRLSRKVIVPLPDEQSRAAILKVHLRNVPLEHHHHVVASTTGSGASVSSSATNATMDQAALLIARLTGGFSGAELANVVNEAAFLAARRESDTVALGDLVDAVGRTRYGVGGDGGGGGGGWSKKIRDWLIDTSVGGSGATSDKGMQRTQPLGS